MKNSVTMDWDKMAVSGGTKTMKKSGPFVSRVTGLDANGLRPSSFKRKRGLSFSEPCKLEKTVEIPIQKTSEGKFYYQARVKGKFGKRMEISESLARKLGGE
jgi:hypothetical protein